MSVEDGRIPAIGRLGPEQPTHELMSISQFDFQEVIETFLSIYGENRAKATENLALRVWPP
jgi:hypothetical protein